MKKLLILLLACSLAFSAEPNPFADSGGGMDDDESIFDDETPKTATNKLMFLDAVQKKFWSPSRKPSDNTINIKYVAGESHKIRTRANMTTTFIFDNDKIASATLGDSIGFELKELGTNKYDLSNIITIKPKLVGIDTNLTIIGESGNVYTFYVFSTDYKNRRNPAFLVFISETRKVGKIKVENLEEKAKKEQEKIFQKLIAQNNSDPNIIEEETENEIIIGDTINKIKIKKNEIVRGYMQYPKRNWYGKVSKESIKLQAKEIFHDKKWTYFKFDRELATSKFPAIFRVIDGYDNPMNSRIVGDYLIVETIADKWTMRIGDEWVCVRSKEYVESTLQEIKEKELKAQNAKESIKRHSKTKFKPKNINKSNDSNYNIANNADSVADNIANLAYKKVNIENVENIKSQESQVESQANTENSDKAQSTENADDKINTEQIIAEKQEVINQLQETKKQLQELQEMLKELKKSQVEKTAIKNLQSEPITPNIIDVIDNTDLAKNSNANRVTKEDLFDNSTTDDLLKLEVIEKNTQKAKPKAQKTQKSKANSTNSKTNKAQSKTNNAKKEDLPKKTTPSESNATNAENATLENNDNDIDNSPKQKQDEQSLEIETTLKKDNENEFETQEENYQGEFNEKEKPMTEKQKAEVESHYKDLELPQGMEIENVFIKENDI